MRSILLVLLTVLSLFSCHNDDELKLIVEDLKSENDSVRFRAIENIENFKLNIKQQKYLLKEAKNKYPPAQFEWKSIPGILVDIATKIQNEDIIKEININYSYYDSYAKTHALSFLSDFDNKKSIESFKELLLKYPSEINYLPTGVLDKNYSYKHIIFPDLLSLIGHVNIDADILLLFLNHLNDNQLHANDFLNYKSDFVKISKKYRNQILNLQKSDIDVWDDDEYQNARYKAGIVADLMGYFNDESVIKELTAYLDQKDKKLMMFAVVSLMKIGEVVDDSYIRQISSDNECRKWFYDNLNVLNKADIFPEEYKTQEAFAESDLTNWLLYPTEMARLPDSIELMKVVEMDTKSEDGIVEYYLFRFKSNHPDWQDEGWLAGVSGYFPKKEKPLTSGYGYTFSSFEKWNSKSPEEHVQAIRDLIDDAYRNR